MNRFSMPLGAALVALTLFAAAPAAHAGERPIGVGGWGLLIPGGDFNDFSYINGLGEGNHLAKCILSLNLNNSELWSGHLPEVLPVALMLETVNGDRLTARVDSTFDAETGVVTGVVTFMGGSGRFTNATGSANIVIVPETPWFIDTGWGTYPLEGTRCAWTIEGMVDY